MAYLLTRDSQPAASVGIARGRCAPSSGCCQSAPGMTGPLIAEQTAMMTAGSFMIIWRNKSFFAPFVLQ